jgi:DNA-binding HxlR family transcriptional regulator
MTDADEQGPLMSRGYGQYCPITRAVEVLGERWSLLIVRDMLIGATRFNDIARGNPGLSRSLLSKRLRQLERAGIAEHVEDRWLLTAAGRDLQDLVFGLGQWGARWQFDEPREDELDPALLMWWVHDRLDYSALSDRRVVIEFRFSDHPDRFWILRDAQGPSVCKFDPGFGVDATVRSDLPTMYQVWLGKRNLREALRSGKLDIQGTPAVAKRLPSALQLNPVASFVAAESRS